MHIYDPIPDVFLDLGFVVWYKYSLMILLGIIAAAILGIREGKKIGITSNDILDGLIIIVPLSIVGTRLWYVVFEWQRYANDLLGIFRISDGGLAIHGGFITAFISAYFYTKYKKIDMLKAFDLMAPGFLIAQAFGRWGNFFNQEAHGGIIGGVTDGTPNLTLDAQRDFLSNTLRLPDFITNNMFIEKLDGINYYHPTFLYESIWNLTGFIIMLILRRTKLLRIGDLFAVYLIWYSVGRFFIEAMRTDSLYIGDTGLRTAQITSIVMILAGIAFIVFSRLVLKPKHYYQAIEENRI